jgi:hypothetical protein
VSASRLFPAFPDYLAEFYGELVSISKFLLRHVSRLLAEFSKKDSVGDPLRTLIHSTISALSNSLVSNCDPIPFGRFTLSHGSTLSVLNDLLTVVFDDTIFNTLLPLFVLHALTHPFFVPGAQFQLSGSQLCPLFRMRISSSLNSWSPP